jgi:hypothetical protein
MNSNQVEAVKRLLSGVLPLRGPVIRALPGVVTSDDIRAARLEFLLGLIAVELCRIGNEVCSVGDVIERRR